MKFFLGKDEDEKQDSDSESEVGVVIKSSFLHYCNSNRSAILVALALPICPLLLLSFPSCFLQMFLHLTKISVFLTAGPY